MHDDDEARCVACGRRMPLHELEVKEHSVGTFRICIAWKLCPWRANPVEGY